MFVFILSGNYLSYDTGELTGGWELAGYLYAHANTKRSWSKNSTKIKPCSRRVSSTALNVFNPNHN